MIKEIIHELIYLLTPDPGMMEYDQGNKLIAILIMIICLVLVGDAVIPAWLY